MPLAKAKRAEYMRSYRAKRRSEGQKLAAELYKRIESSQSE